MTTDNAVHTGERRRQRSEIAGDLNGVAVGRTVRALPPVPILDWPANLFVSAIVDNNEFDDELVRNNQPRFPSHESPNKHTVPPVFDDGVHGTVIWPRQPAHSSSFAGAAP